MRSNSIPPKGSGRPRTSGPRKWGFNTLKPDNGRSFIVVPRGVPIPSGCIKYWATRLGLRFVTRMQASGETHIFARTES